MIAFIYPLTTGPASPFEFSHKHVFRSFMAGFFWSVPKKLMPVNVSDAFLLRVSRYFNKRKIKVPAEVLGGPHQCLLIK